MITLITGAPGSGKSAALVSLLGQLAKDRLLYVDGVPELKIDHKVLDKPHDWPTDVPDGSAVVIDEVQRIWPTRGPGQRPGPDVAALETHRHRGLDFFLVTQHPRMLDPHVKSLCGRHVHLRDIGVLGRWWYEWPECSNDPSSAWKNAPVKKRYRIDKATFALYKSASIHIKPIRSFPVALVVIALALLVLLAGVFFAYRSITSKFNPAPAAPAPVVQSGPVPSGQHEAKPTKEPLDESVAYIARISHRPETAPAYDELRKVQAMPVITGSMCLGDTCRCFTEQGTDAGLTSDQCAKWAARRPFNPYRVSSGTAPQGARSDAVQGQPARSRASDL